ncbi:hypothetical protein N0V88_006267 [Collariella sp. IMI 366227]|nr:hypothetical protein N0V88_006267 [Collariella sp. IMI 366227]
MSLVDQAVQPPHTPLNVDTCDHPGSTEQEIKDEPDWAQLQGHAIGVKTPDGQRPGISYSDNSHEAELAEARRLRDELHRMVTKGDLVNFRDLIQGQHDFHLRHPENRSLGWRYVLDTTEDWVKYQQKWPINQQKEAKQKEEAEKKGVEEEGKEDKGIDHGVKEKEKEKEIKEEEQLLPKERVLLEVLKRDANMMANLKQNDGNHKSPQIHNRSSIAIDEQDQFTPDNWLPRCPDLIRLTGKHPMNAEPPLTRLFDGGLITPNELHFVRNHGAVPRLLWELHTLDITYDNHTTTLTMDQLKSNFSPSVINIPVAFACTGNRRKELNLLRKTKGANNAASSVGCAYWKGPTLRSILLAAGVPATPGRKNPSEELRIAQAKLGAEAPQKQFTREEIEKHDKEGDCWLVVDNKVYDVTSVLAWHPGGKPSILAHAGKCHSSTTEDFASVHDDVGYQKLHECLLGSVTKKTAEYIKQTAEATAKAKAKGAARQGQGRQLALQKHWWVPVKLLDRHSLSKDTRIYTFALPEGKTELGLGTCQHLQVGDIIYLGNGTFHISGPHPRTLHFPRISLILGGSGITPGYALLSRIAQTEGDMTEGTAVPVLREWGYVEDENMFGF